MLRITRGGAGLLLALAAATGCHRPQAPPPAEVTVARPMRRPVRDYHDYTGRIDAVETANVRARVKGFLQKIYFKEGVEVKKGHLLYLIDPSEYEAAVAKAEAD